MPLKQEPADQPGTFQPMHGLKLVKEDVVPQEQLLHFPAVEQPAAKGRNLEQ